MKLNDVEKDLCRRSMVRCGSCALRTPLYMCFISQQKILNFPSNPKCSESYNSLITKIEEMFKEIDYENDKIDKHTKLKAAKESQLNILNTVSNFKSAI